MAKISVIIPVYNREKTIKRAIDSVIAQQDEKTNPKMWNQYFLLQKRK